MCFVQPRLLARLGRLRRAVLHSFFARKPSHTSSGTWPEIYKRLRPDGVLEGL